MGAYSGKEETLPAAERLTTSVLRYTKTPQCANIIWSIKKKKKGMQGSNFTWCPLSVWKHQTIFSALKKLIMYNPLTKQSKIVTPINGKTMKYFLTLQVPSCRGYLLGRWLQHCRRLQRKWKIWPLQEFAVELVTQACVQKTARE